MEQVVVNVSQEALYKAYLFYHERTVEYMRLGTRMTPEDLHTVLTVLFKLQEAAMALQEGENVFPQSHDTPA